MKPSRIFEIFKGEEGGKISFGRVLGTATLSPVMAAYCWAAFQGKWEIVTSMTPELLLLVGSLYAIGKVGNAITTMGEKKSG